MKKTSPKTLRFLVFILISTIVLSSCTSKKNIIYFQDVKEGTEQESRVSFETIFQPDDLLSITISAFDMEAARPFNLNSMAANNSGSNNINYLINNEGYIDFPILGEIKLGGLKKSDAIQVLKEKLSVYVNNPIVQIEIVNFKITILGEVKSPGTFTIPNERLTIIEAIGLAGDLAISGKRNNILVIRDVNFEKSYIRVDLTKKDIFTSPTYYLKQNDVIYVEPTNTRIQSSSVGANTSLYFPIISMLLTIYAFIIK
ncbi:MAG: polysaccharide biosynthesis/export family protein [Flavobacteriaceae bacterium]|nr:polysaccharide biosynthesis/export family protein [Flavobacteriaceae bacterium]